MQMTQLRSFHAVATTGSFTAAAEALHVSQPTITTQVRQLEDRYNVELFHRSGRRVRLTDIGNRLLVISRHIFSLRGDAIQLLSDAGELRSGHLRVAAVGPSHVTAMLVAFSKRYPGIQISVSTGNSQDVRDRLLDYRADIGVLAQVLHDERFVSAPFSEHPVVIFTSTKHRFARRRSIRCADLQGEKLILREQGSTTRKSLEAALNAAGVRPEVVMEVSSREIIREAVAQGMGIAAVSEAEYIPGPALHVVQISDAQVRTFAHLVCLVERRQMRMVSAFFDVVAEDAVANGRR